MMNNLALYLKDFRELESGPNCKEEELVSYSVKHIRSLVKGKVIEQLNGAEVIKASDLLKILDTIE